MSNEQNPRISSEGEKKSRFGWLTREALETICERKDDELKRMGEALDAARQVIRLIAQRFGVETRYQHPFAGYYLDPDGTSPLLKMIEDRLAEWMPPPDGFLTQEKAEAELKRRQEDKDND